MENIRLKEENLSPKTQRIKDKKYAEAWKDLSQRKNNKSQDRKPSLDKKNFASRGSRGNYSSSGS
jgi:hypothetical protein